MNKKQQHEIRSLPVRELRISPVAEDGTRTLSGKAIVFNQRSQDLGGFQEQIAPGAVSKTLASDKNILLLNNHNSGQPLGSTRAGNLKITTDANGVSFTCQVDTRISYANDLALSVQAGVVSGCSFGFRCLDDSWSQDNKTAIRTVNELELFELSLCSAPAYEQTQVDVRSCPKEFRSLLSSDDDGQACDDPDCEACQNGDYADCPNQNTDADIRRYARLELAKRR